MPQVHGAVRDVLADVERKLDIEMNSVTDNPLVFPDEDGEALKGRHVGFVGRRTLKWAFIEDERMPFMDRSGLLTRPTRSADHVHPFSRDPKGERVR